MDEEKEGMMVRMSLVEAKAQYGDRLRLAPLGAIEKRPGEYRALHDGTNRSGVNPELRQRDQVRAPGAGELKKVLEIENALPGAMFGLAMDVSKVHRRYKHARCDWGNLACQLGDPEEVWLNKV